MEADEMIEKCREHTMYTWSSQEDVEPLPIDRAEGIYFWTPDGKKFLDFNSQLMSVNVGHSHPKVVEAMEEALEGVIYAFPGSATEPRAEIGERLDEITPDHLDRFFFTLGGAEANENAVRAARMFTGNQKILSRHRSYHGATNLCMQLSGDPRRWPNEPGPPGFVRVMHPDPYDYSFGETDREKTEQNLRYLEELIMYEGPETIAAMMIEPVTGTNGILPPPDGYLEGLEELLDEHDILLICDEVMAGFGRTGEWFSFEHADVEPDIVTMAKGLTSSYAPLGCAALSEEIADHFDDNTFWGGLTYNSHPVSLAPAIANIEVIQEEGLVEHAAQMESVMREEMDRLDEKHPSFGEGRCIGLFGIIDVHRNDEGDPMADYNDTSEPMDKLAEFFRDEGLFTFVRWFSFMCNPPLCIEEEQLRQAFEVVDRGLDITDRYYEGSG